MSEGQKTPIIALTELGKIDLILARVLAEKKQYTARLQKKQEELKQVEGSFSGKNKIYLEKKARYDKEERAIRDERDKLVTRRKALAALNNYKVQQAAEREIEHANRQLALRDEALLPLLQELEGLSSENSSYEVASKQLRDEIASIEKEIREVAPSLNSKEKEQQAKRELITREILPAFLDVYERIRLQYPSDVITPVVMSAKTCSTCYIQIRPQLIVEIHKGKSLVNCPGCGRILYIEESSSKESSSKESSKEEPGA